ncbi:unnamed protein product [Mytilus coruscus]|uniref:Peptidase A2 domain-containing protein n=1 Tax=Mytilus coruscus TaxID=42192 RepID=A0A6J8C7F2_MYTCO|nr:unnamed protein product [Mytilus coruscus]
MENISSRSSEKFDFCKPETWTKWIQRFDRFRSASGLEEKAGDTQEIDFKIDTGADVTVISDSDLNGINSIELMKANKRLSGPGNTNLNVVGKFQCMLETKDKFSVQDIYVVKGLSKPLLGRPAIQALGIIDKVNVSSVNASSEANNYYRGKYPKIFNGLGKNEMDLYNRARSRRETVCLVNTAQSTITFNG